MCMIRSDQDFYVVVLFNTIFIACLLLRTHLYANALFQGASKGWSEKSGSQNQTLGPEAGEGCSGSGEQTMVGLSELSVHDSIEQRVDAAVEPREVCAEHVQDLWSSTVFVCDVKQQKRNETAHKAQENGEAHACHTLEFTVIWCRRVGGGVGGLRRFMGDIWSGLRSFWWI